jgi:GTP-binding protein
VFDEPLIKNKHRPKVFHDRVRLQVSGGRGGNGCSSYARTDKGKGAPDGGNGGQGGAVYLETSSDLHQYTFSAFHLKGEAGHPGSSDQQNGSAGADHIALIPPGTIVREIIGRSPDTEDLVFRHVADLNKGGLRIKVAEGGVGGYGNRVFKTDYRHNNRFSTSGQPGATRWLQLELKTIADIGLIGFPNAGKSSLLAALSSAKPKIANYPFTTIQPEIGSIELQKHLKPNEFQELINKEKVRLIGNNKGGLAPFSVYDQLSMADLPGLIEGAHRNVGLGHAFLKHIERCSVLLFVIDCSMEFDDLQKISPSAVEPFQYEYRDPVKDFLTLQEEIIRYNSDILTQKPIAIFANKCDQQSDDRNSDSSSIYSKHLKRLKKLVELSELLPQVLQEANSAEKERRRVKFIFDKKKEEKQTEVKKQVKVSPFGPIRVIEGSAKEGVGLKELVKELFVLTNQAKRYGSNIIQPEKEIRMKRNNEANPNSGYDD